MDTPKKRGRPKKIPEFGPTETQISKKHMDTLIENIEVSPVTMQYVEVPVVREVFIEKPQLEGFELYKKLKELGFFQGGIGQFQEDMNGTERVYLPHASEIYAQFAQNPQGWDTIRDYLARAFIELSKK